MGCNCRKNRQVYTGPVTTSDSNTGGQPPIERDAVVADATPTPQPK